jgi:hypothetical protein
MVFKITNQRSFFLLTISFFIFCLFCILIQADHINRDGSGYIIQAHLLYVNNYDAALSEYPSLILAKLILMIKLFFNLSYFNSALFINSSFLIISIYFLLQILWFCKKDFRLLTIGLLVSLSSIPIMDTYLTMVIRDHGMWALSLGGFYFFIKYTKNFKLHLILLSIIFFILAGLFRPEAFLFIFLIQIYISLNLFKSKKITIDSKLLFGIFIFLFIAFLILFYLNIGRYNDIVERPLLFISNFKNSLPIASNDFWFSELINNFPLVIKYSLLGSIFLYKWLSSIGIYVMTLFLLGVFYAKKNKILSNEFYYIFFSFYLLNLLIIFINLLSLYVISGRYFVFILWLSFIFVSYAIFFLFFEIKFHNKYLHSAIKFFLILSLILSVLVNLFDKKHNDLPKDIANWVKDNSVNFDDFYFKDYRVMVYLNHFNNSTITINDAIRKFNFPYLILNENDARSNEAIYKKYYPIYSNSEFKKNQETIGFIIYKRIE